ncbi:MAG: substrate-binding domain-containing protein [Lachnospirales bacterium]
MKKTLGIKGVAMLSVLTLGVTGLVSCGDDQQAEDTKSESSEVEAEETVEDEVEEATEEPTEDSDITTLTIATTTSLYNTGLLDALETDFESKYDYDVEYIAVGSGAAMKMGEDGEADGIFVHSKDAEEALVEKGVSLGRNPIMYNYFEIVGPQPLEATDFEGVLNEIREGKTFVSRGDDSGTNVKELAMWGDKLPSDYVETGKGMLDTLVVASEMGAYTLTDDATFITHKDDLALVEIYKDDDFFKNEYSFHCINLELNEYINSEGASAYLDYLQSDETLDFIANYGLDMYGQSLYTLSN